MKLFIQKFIMLFVAATSLLQTSVYANGLDARLRDDMQAKHYEPGGKYHLFGSGRGSVKNRVYSVHTFGTTAVGPVLPITHERTGFEGVIGYETHFSGHGHEVHGPFDNHDSRSTSDFSGGVDGGFTVYQLHRTGSEIHPADGYDGPQGGGYPAPKGARDIYSYYVKGTSTKTKINIVPQAPFSDRWLKENADATSDFFSRADEAGKLIWENDPNKNWLGNRMDDIRGFIQGAANPFVTGFQGLGVEAIADSVVNPVTDATAQQTLQGINNLGKLSPEAQLAAASTLQDSAFAVKDSINSAKQWADAHPNITATAQTALSGAEAAGTVWVGKKVEINPTKWDWVKNTDYGTSTTRPMQTLDGEMFATNNVDFNTNKINNQIHDGAQGKHIPNHNNYIPGKSMLNNSIDPQELLLGIHSGKYPIISRTSRGMPVVDFGKPIGVDASSGLSTNFGAVHTGKKGSHIVPHNPNKIEKIK